VATEGAGTGTGPSRSASAGDPQLRRDIGFVGLMFTSVGSIIGSGWLFGALSASEIAGPAAILSWILGGAAMILLALVHAELGGMFPVAGGSARFPHYAFGSLAGFAGGWFAFLGAVTTAPIEVEAALQYATGWLGISLTHSSGGETVLTAGGYAAATVLMLLFSFINILGVRWLSETNKTIVWWKIFVPVFAVIVLAITHFDSGNFSASAGHDSGFAPFGAKGVFSAIASGGVIFAYLGFEQAIQLGGESKNPRRNIPLAVIGSMVLGVVLYIALQLAFVGSLQPSDLSKGWASISLGGKSETFGPFAGLATGLGLGWLAVILYIDAVISPGGTGLLYVGTGARLQFALGRNRYFPRIFAKLTNRGVPIWSILFAFAVGMIVFLPFPGWQKLVGFVTSATVLAYATAPLAFGALRRQDPNRERPYRLVAGGLLAPLAFVVANEVILFSGWAVVYKLILAIVVGFALLALNYTFSAPERRPRLDLRHATWIAPYLIGLAVVSYLSSFDTTTKGGPFGLLVGPTNTLHFGWDVLAMAVVSLVVYFVAMRQRLPDDAVQVYIEEVTAEAEQEEREVVTAAG
jgi:amino acid transporter